MTTPKAPTATVAECLQVHGSLTSEEIAGLEQHWAALDHRLRGFEAAQVTMHLFVKERDTNSQHLTLETHVHGWPPLVASTSDTEIGHALNVVRDEMIRLIGDAKDKHWGHRKGGERAGR